MGANFDRDSALALAKNGPGWLAERRAAAWETHRDLPLPDRAQHRWRYVDPARLVPQDLPLVHDAGVVRTGTLPDDAPASVVIRRGAAGEGAGTVVELGREAREAGVEVLDLETAARTREDLVAPHLATIVAPSDSPFAALNAAFWSGGLCVRVPRGVALSRPIHVQTAAPASGLVLPRNLVLLEEGAEATLLEELTGTTDGAALMVHRTNEVHVAQGARVTLVYVQELPLRATAASVTHVRLERDAFARQLFAAFGAGLAKADLVIDARGAGAGADVLGAVFGAGRQVFDHHTILEHHAPDTTTNLDVRVALGGKARSSATGRLWIGTEALRSQAYQENRNLLLSETANAISIPELEILTNEVQAKHGATVGPIDDEQLYYLGSRGMAAPEATAMIVGGFFEALLARAPEGLATERVRARVAERLLSTH